MANPINVSQVSLSGNNVTIFIVTAHYESYLKTPETLQLKNNDGLTSQARVRRVRHWGEAANTPSPPPPRPPSFPGRRR